jgi:hypothetical protein
MSVPVVVQKQLLHVCLGFCVAPRCNPSTRSMLKHKQESSKGVWNAGAYVHGRSAVGVHQLSPLCLDATQDAKVTCSSSSSASSSSSSSSACSSSGQCSTALQ